MVWWILFSARVDAAPVIRSVDPAAGLPGETVEISGFGFGAADGLAIFLDGEAVTSFGVGEEAVTFEVPTGGRSGLLTIEAETGTTVAPLPFLVLRTVAGTVDQGLFADPASIRAGSFGQWMPLDGSGGFDAAVSVGQLDVLWAFDPSVDTTLMALVADGDANVTIDAHSTALAVVVQSLRLLYPNPLDVGLAAVDVAADGRFPQLVGKVEAAASTGADVFADGSFLELAAAVAIDHIPPAVAAQLGPPFIENNVEGVELRALNPGGVARTLEPQVFPHPTRPDDEARFDFGVLEGRPNGLDWSIELFPLDPEQFPNGFASIAGLEGSDAPVPSNDIPVDRGFVRAEMPFRYFDLLGLAVNATYDALFGAAGVKAETDVFPLSLRQDAIYLAQAYSGNVPNGLGLQGGVLETVDPNSQWAAALAGNLVIVAIDTLNAAVGATKAFTGGSTDLVADLSGNLAKTLSIYREQDRLDAAAVADITQTAASSLTKSLVKGAVEGGAAATSRRVLGAVAGFFDITGRIASGGQAAGRTLSLLTPTNLALERAVIVTGNPFQPFITAVSPTVAQGGQLITVTGGNFGFDARERTVELCSFDSTGGNIAATLPVAAVGGSAARLTFDLPDSATLRTTFPAGRFRVCVTKDLVRAVSAEITIPPAPAITGISPATIAPMSLVEIGGSGFGEGTVLKIDGQEMATVSLEESRISAYLPPYATPGAGSATYTLTVCSGGEESGGFEIEVVRPVENPVGGGGDALGAVIAISVLDMSNVPDGEISVLEAFLLARGELGRPVEMHVEGEPKGTQREIDLLGNRDAGLGLRDTILFPAGSCTRSPARCPPSLATTGCGSRARPWMERRCRRAVPGWWWRTRRTT